MSNGGAFDGRGQPDAGPINFLPLPIAAESRCQLAARSNEDHFSVVKGTVECVLVHDGALDALAYAVFDER